jgi:hypothetical protein
LRLGLLRLRLRSRCRALVAELLDHLLATQLRCLIVEASGYALSLRSGSGEHRRPSSHLRCILVAELLTHHAEHGALRLGSRPRRLDVCPLRCDVSVNVALNDRERGVFTASGKRSASGTETDGDSGRHSTGSATEQPCRVFAHRSQSVHGTLKTLLRIGHRGASVLLDFERSGRAGVDGIALRFSSGCGCVGALSQ